LYQAAPAASQDVFSQIDQLRKDLNDTRTELNDLKSLVYQMRKNMLHNVGTEKPAAAAPTEVKQRTESPQISDEELTVIICKAVGDFFSDADRVLRMTNPDEAQARMSDVFKKLNGTLQKYSGLHRVSKLLDIYEGLAWDVYTAVEMRYSLLGNRDFLEMLNKHKKKYNDTCPK
jgi:hypothetical protein